MMIRVPRVLADPALRAEVRTELRSCVADLRRLQQYHVRAWGGSEAGHPASGCLVCMRYDAEVEGISRAIHRFDGRKRWQWRRP